MPEKRKRKTIRELEEEERRLKELIAKKRQKLKALKRRIRKEYRQREARFLISIGRTILKYGKVYQLRIDNNITKTLVFPLNTNVIEEIFKEYDDIVESNEDFKKWKEIISQ